MPNTYARIVGAAVLGATLGAVAGAVGIGGTGLLLVAGAALGALLGALAGTLARLSVLDLGDNHGFQAGALLVAAIIALLLACAWVIGGSLGDTTDFSSRTIGYAHYSMEAATVLIGAVVGFVAGGIVGALARLDVLSLRDTKGLIAEDIGKTRRVLGGFILGAVITGIIGGPLVAGARVGRITHVVLVAFGAIIGFIVGTLGGAVARLLGGAMGGDDETGRRQDGEATGGSIEADHGGDQIMGSTVGTAVMGAVLGTIGGAVAGAMLGIFWGRPAVVVSGEAIIVAISKVVVLSIGGALGGAVVGAIAGTTAGAIAGAILGALGDRGEPGGRSMPVNITTAADGGAIATGSTRGPIGSLIAAGPISGAITGALLLAPNWGVNSVFETGLRGLVLGAITGIVVLGMARLRHGAFGCAGALSGSSGVALAGAGAALGAVIGAILGGIGGLPFDSLGKSGSFMVNVFITHLQQTGPFMGMDIRWILTGALIAGLFLGTEFLAVGRDISGIGSGAIGPVVGAGIGVLSALLAASCAILGGALAGGAFSAAPWGAISGAVLFAGGAALADMGRRSAGDG